MLSDLIYRSDIEGCSCRSCGRVGALSQVKRVARPWHASRVRVGKKEGIRGGQQEGSEHGALPAQPAMVETPNTPCNRSQQTLRDHQGRLEGKEEQKTSTRQREARKIENMPL